MKRAELAEMRLTMVCRECEGDIEPEQIGKRYQCGQCWNALRRERNYARKKHSELTPEQRFKANARSYANAYQRRDKLERQPCKNCGEPLAEKHHHDYSKPLDVEWLCQPCHRKMHLAA